MIGEIEHLERKKSALKMELKDVEDRLHFLKCHQHPKKTLLRLFKKLDEYHRYEWFEDYVNNDAKVWARTDQTMWVEVE